MKQLLKIKKQLTFNKKALRFLLGIAFIGFIFGCLFILIISKTDQESIKNYLNSFIENIKNLNYFEIFKNTMINNLLFIIVIWLLGMSVIGVPFNVFYYFFKGFVLGFTCVSFILTYRLKGCIFSLIYIVPHNIFNIFVFTILVYYSLNFSILLIYSIFKKKSINFKIIFNKYIKILLITLIGIVVSSIYEAFILPNIMKSLLFLIK